MNDAGPARPYYEVSAETRALLALQLAIGQKPRLTTFLLERFGSAEAVLQAPLAQLRQIPHFTDELAHQLAASLQNQDVETELALLAQHQTHLRVLGTAEYPSLLAEIPTPPRLLYCRGTLTKADQRSVALVGSRRCTHYGRRVTEQLASGLARAGWTVISGLARGIDGVAHRAALKAGGRTLAVLAGGLSTIYPPEHADLADEVASAGALLSETNMRMAPLAGMFPARNRIISGMSQAVVVIEAADRSGALITAEHAGEQGRSVLAVPGPVDSSLSGGTNALIRQGAILVRHVEDVLEELQEGLAAPSRPIATGSAAAPTLPFPAEPPPDLTELQLRIWHFLADQPRHLDELADHLAVAVPQLSTNLMQLELKKTIRRLPGNRYERC